MTNYAVGIGHDVDLGDLNDLDPQPASTGIQVTRRNRAASGTISEDGLYLILEWTLLEDEDEYQSVLEDFDLMDNDFADVTVYARDSRWNWGSYNGTAEYPEQGRDVKWDNFFPRNLRLLV